MNFDYLDFLESESIFILREVYAQFQNPVILFSGGKDSIVVSLLAQKAFYPSRLPFPLLHVDTGHNFPETIKYRDWLVSQLNAKLIVSSVQTSIDKGRAVEEVGPYANRNVLQISSLLDTIKEYQIDACIGGARRDEEKSRAKERIFSHRNEYGHWDPKNQRPELWNLFNGHKRQGEHFRIFPISNWTEMDIWHYIKRHNITLPELYFASEREVIRRNNGWIAVSKFIQLQSNEIPEKRKIRFRTCGDMTITGGFESSADTVEKIITELSQLKTSERNSREDDKRSDAAMEERKVKGYF